MFLCKHVLYIIIRNIITIIFFINIIKIFCKVSIVLYKLSVIKIFIDKTEYYQAYNVRLYGEGNTSISTKINELYR